MARHHENTGFTCLRCGQEVKALTNGSYRNHCPFCFYSLHVDQKPGDRAAHCHALMKPVGLRFKSNKGWQIIHVCTSCGTQSVNKVAEYTQQPDDFMRLANL